MDGTLIVVDAANVVGSVPDGWWRDRAGAAARLRDRLAAAAGSLLGGGELLLVVEGRASGVGAVPGVRVVSATGSGDDAIVAVVRDAVRESGRRCVVVTADRGLRARVTALGASVTGPGTLLRELDGLLRELDGRGDRAGGPAAVVDDAVPGPGPASEDQC